ncbi:MAG TPA: DUF2382 domain-containing protein [Geodermatophilus sp.]|nr:DUF2382 domain-containing protein [Geodermatophilus sp.]
MLTEREVSAAIGSTAHGSDGDKIGTVEHFFVDDRTGAPTWVAVSTGLFGVRHSIVPATEATFDDGLLRLPVTREAVRTAPHLTGDHLGPEDEGLLRRHYGLDTPATGTPTWISTGTGLTPPGAGPEDDVPAAAGGAPTTAGTTPDPAATAPFPGATYPPPPPAAARPAAPPADAPSTAAPPSAGVAPDAAGPVAAPGADGAMTRSEEQLRVSTEEVAATRVRLVKYVVTEEVQVTVPIRREEIRIEEVPLDAPDPGVGESLVPAGAGAADGRGSSGLPDEIVLHAERPVVGVEVVPVERVRLRTEVVQGQEQVHDRVQREQIVAEQGPSPRSGVVR